MSNVAYATDIFRGGNSSGSSRMDNKKQGHFALFRSVLSTDWAKDIAKLALWVRLLGEATYRPRSVEFAGREWFLQPGQLVTTPAIMARKLRDQDNSEKSAQAVTRMLKFFTKEGMISTEGSPFGTVITITNYARYQGILADEPSDNPPDKPQASNGAGFKVVADKPSDNPPDKQNKKVLNKNKDKPTLTRLEGGTDDDSLKEKLIALLQGNFNFDNAKELHDAVESEILKSGLLCQREFKVADRGDGRCGKVDLYVTDPVGGSCGIELDWKSPREKSVVKLQQLPSGFILLRETVLEERYEIAGISVVNANTGEIDKTPSGYYLSFMDAYNKITDGQLPSAKDLTPERKRAIKTLVNGLAKPNVEGFSAYLNAFLGMAKPFYFGDNDRNWSADFDYILRPKVLTKVREGSL